MLKRLAEDLTRDVLSVGVIACPSDDVRPDAMEVAIVKLDETRRVSLHRFDQRPVIVFEGHAGS
jgi:hypothetical protein